MQSSNPYLQQIGARRLLGYTTTVGVALPMMKKMGQMATEIPDKVLDAYANRFAPEFEKGQTMVPVEAQDEKQKRGNQQICLRWCHTLIYLHLLKQVCKLSLTGKNPDQTSLDLYTRAFVDFIKRTLEPFLAPSIAAETGLELIPRNGQFRTKSGGLIADIKNDDDWWGKVMYHAYKKLTPTTIRSGEEIAQAIGGDLSKAGIKRDLYDTVLKVLTGFGIRRQDPFIKHLDLN